MNKEIPAKLRRDKDNAEDAVGLLMAISVVAKRLAQNLMQFQPSDEGGEENGGSDKEPPAD